MSALDRSAPMDPIVASYDRLAARLATLIVMAAGALAGRRLLRW